MHISNNRYSAPNWVDDSKELVQQALRVYSGKEVRSYLRVKKIRESIVDETEILLEAEWLKRVERKEIALKGAVLIDDSRFAFEGSLHIKRENAHAEKRERDSDTRMWRVEKAWSFILSDYEDRKGDFIVDEIVYDKGSLPFIKVSKPELRPRITQGRGLLEREVLVDETTFLYV